MTKYADVTMAGGSGLEQAGDASIEIARARAEAGPVSAAPARPGPRSNVIHGEDHREAIGAAMQEISLCLGRTLGPHGSSALIRDSGGVHIATKDGYTVLKHMVFLQETATMVLDHVRSVSRAVVRRVGDGSTTAVIMADALYQSFADLRLSEKYPPGAIQAAMSACADAVADEVRAAALPPTPDQLAAVATIAANNDPRAGALVAGIYGEYGESANVFVGVSPTEETTVRPEPGYRVLRGMASDAFANTATSDGAAPTVCVLADPRVMVYGGHVGMPEFVGTVMQVGNAVIGRGGAFAVVAQSFAPEVIDAAAKFRLKSSSIGLLLVDHAMATRRGQARLGDLCAVLGASYVEPAEPGAPFPEGEEAEALLAGCGRCATVRSTASETVFVAPGERNPAAVARAQGLLEQIERVDAGNVAEAMGEELDELRARRRALLGLEVTLLAGGATEAEKAQLQYLLDDAALACAAALRSGVVEGMGMVPIRALHGPESRGRILLRVAGEISERSKIPAEEAGALSAEVASATYRSYLVALERVLENARVPWGVAQRAIGEGLAYDLMTRSFSPPGAATVLNPADTDVEVLRGAMSIVGIFATSDQTVLTRVRAGPGHD